MIDQALLLAHLAAKTAKYEKHLLIASVLEGLATAVKRGDFDEKESKS